MDYKSTEEPKSNVAEYEIIDDERVLVKKVGSKKLEIKFIYHQGTAGILCNDFETFIDYNEAKQVEFEAE
jgi:hypothetical protein